MTRGLFVLVFALAVTPDLMAQADSQPPASATVNQSDRQPHILCGMRVFPADPTIDTRMAKPTPPGAFTLGIAQPSTCRDSFARLAPGTSELKRRLPPILGPKR